MRINLGTEQGKASEKMLPEALHIHPEKHAVT